MWLKIVKYMEEKNLQNPENLNTGGYTDAVSPSATAEAGSIAIKALCKCLMSKNVCTLRNGGEGVHKCLHSHKPIFPIQSFCNTLPLNTV
jgi:hypothetical protein